MIYSLLRLLIRLIQVFDLIVFTIIMYLLSWLPRRVTDPFYHRLFRVWCRIFVRAFGIDLKLAQKNQKPFPKHYILIANHPSVFEDIGIPAMFNVYSLSKMSLKKWLIVGRISTASGTIYVKRDSKESRKKAYDELKQTLLEGKNLALYPEGGCKGRRIFENFQYGAFRLSLETGLPIVPVFLQYEAQQDFEWAEQTLLKKFLQLLETKNNRATYYVYDALDPKDFANKEEYAEHVYQQYLAWQHKYLE